MEIKSKIEHHSRHKNEKQEDQVQATAEEAAVAVEVSEAVKELTQKPVDAVPFVAPEGKIVEGPGKKQETLRSMDVRVPGVTSPEAKVPPKGPGDESVPIILEQQITSKEYLPSAGKPRAEVQRVVKEVEQEGKVGQLDTISAWRAMEQRVLEAQEKLSDKDLEDIDIGQRVV